MSRQSVVKRSARRTRSPVGKTGAEARYSDPFVQLNIDPRFESQNKALMTHFLTEMGKIPGRDQTRLSHRSQRYLAKAIKRAKMMGIIPTLSKYSLKHDVFTNVGDTPSRTDKDKGSSRRR